MGNKQPVGAEPNFALQLSPEVRERMNVRLGFPRSPTEEQLRQGVDFERGRRMGQREAAWKAGYAHLQYVVGSEMDAASNLAAELDAARKTQRFRQSVSPLCRYERQAYEACLKNSQDPVNCAHALDRYFGCTERAATMRRMEHKTIEERADDIIAAVRSS